MDIKTFTKYNSSSCSRASLKSYDPEVLISSADSDDLSPEVVCFSGAVEFMTAC